MSDQVELALEQPCEQVQRLRKVDVLVPRQVTPQTAVGLLEQAPDLLIEPPTHPYPAPPPALRPNDLKRARPVDVPILERADHHP